MKKIILSFFLVTILLLFVGCNLNLKEKKLNFNCPDLKGQTIKQATKKFLLTNTGDIYYFEATYNYYNSKEDFALFSNNSNCLKINGETNIEKIEVSNQEEDIFFVDNNQKYYIPLSNDNSTFFESIISVDDLVSDFKTLPEDKLDDKYDYTRVEQINKYRAIQYLKAEKIINSNSVYVSYEYYNSKRFLYIKNSDIYRVIVEYEEPEYNWQSTNDQIIKTDPVVLNNSEKPLLKFLDTQYLVLEYIYKVKSNEIYFKLSELLESDEHVIEMNKGEENLYYIKTNKNYYLLNVHSKKNKEECEKYKDVKCEYGVKVSKLDYASKNHDQYIYVSSHLFITKNGDFIIKK